MSSSQFSTGPVQSRQKPVSWVGILIVAGLIIGAALAVLFAQNPAMGSTTGQVATVATDSRLVFPNGSSWHQSPSIDAATAVVDKRLTNPHGSPWLQSSAVVDKRLTNPHGSSWHQSPGTVDKRLTNAHGTSWLQSPAATADN